MAQPLNLLSSLHLGLVMGRSVDNPNSAGDVSTGCAITHNLLSTQYYASDYSHGPSQTAAQTTCHWGPFASQALARTALRGDDLVALDANGTDGVSLWLILP